MNSEMFSQCERNSAHNVEDKCKRRRLILAVQATKFIFSRKLLIFRHQTHPWVHFSSRDIIHDLFSGLFCHSEKVVTMTTQWYIWIEIRNSRNFLFSSGMEPIIKVRYREKVYFLFLVLLNSVCALPICDKTPLGQGAAKTPGKDSVEWMVR